MYIPKHDYSIGVDLSEPHASRIVLHIHIYFYDVWLQWLNGYCQTEASV